MSDFGFDTDEGWEKSEYANLNYDGEKVDEIQPIPCRKIIKALEPKRWWHWLGIRRRCVDFEVNFDITRFIEKCEHQFEPKEGYN